MSKKITNLILLLIAIIILIGTFVYEYTFEETKVVGDSMENTLQDKDSILINKLAYQNHSPKRYDIIVFPYNKNTYFIKRIIGLPGETVQIINSSIYINGTILYENYGKESMDEYTEGIAKDKILIGKDEYFVLGDNRNDSMDSRNKEVGLIKQEDILGKAEIRVYPFSSFGKIRS